MLTWLKSDPETDHPLADPKTARDLLADLVLRSPTGVLETLTEYLDGAREGVGLTPVQAFEIVDLIDRTAKPFHRPLTGEYLETVGMQQAASLRIAHVQSGYWHALAKAYRMLLEAIEAGDPAAQRLESEVARLGARALRAFNVHLKWCLLRYVVVDPVQWGALARIYAVAEKRGLADTPVEVYPGAKDRSSVRREMLKAMMLAVSSTDALPPPQVEIVERLCAQYSEFFTLRPALEPGAYFNFDLASDEPPARAVDPGVAGGARRFFGPGAAAPHLKRLAEDIRTNGAIPSTVRLGAVYPVHDVVMVLEHLAHYWAPMPPSRRESRRAADDGVEAVRGLRDIIAAVDAAEFGWNFDPDRYQRWELRDQSNTGFGAIVPRGRGDEPGLGGLVGLRYLDGGVSWSVGIVRRINGAGNGHHHLGIELLSRGVIRVALGVVLSDGTLDEDGESAVDALLLPSASDRSAGRLTTHVAFRPDAFDPRVSYALKLFGMEYLLLPKAILEQTDDYVIAEYRLLLRAGE
jgi:hypothetical protein